MYNLNKIIGEVLPNRFPRGVQYTKNDDLLARIVDYKMDQIRKNIR